MINHANIRHLLTGGIAVLSLILGAGYLPSHALAHKAEKSRLAQVRFIDRGLGVQPPHKKMEKGKVKMSLYQLYLLGTKHDQRASITFRDKTTLHMNQNTDIQLKNPHLSYVKKGEVDEALTPGSNHKVQTAAAVASAIGTNFDVKLVHGGTIFLVLHGVIKVHSKKGTVTVKPNQESVVINGQKPQPPKHVNVAKAMNWTKGLPTPNLPENVGLDAAGGKVVAFSSQYQSATEGNFWQASFINDGRLDYGWQSNSGQITNQYVKIELPGGKPYKIIGVVIDPSATHGDPVSSDLKDFQIAASTTGSADADFTTVFSGTCQQSNSLQTFTFTSPVTASYIELLAQDNYGSPDWISVAELEIVGTPA